MEITQVNLNDEQKNILLPPIVSGLLYIRGTMVFAAIEEKSLITLAVVAPEKSGLANYSIRFLKLYNESKKLALELLLEHIESVCRKRGSKMLSVKIIDDASKQQTINDVLIQNNYTKLQLNGKFLMYSFKDISETEFVKTVEKIYEIKNYVKFAKQVDKKQLIAFLDNLKKTRANMNVQQPDLIFGRFLVIGGKIKAYIDLHEVFPAILLLQDVYVEKGKETKNALPMMLASVVQITEAMMPEDTVIILPLYSEYLYKSFKKVFGEAVVEQDIFEYAKRIDNQEVVVFESLPKDESMILQNFDFDGEINNLEVDISMIGGYKKERSEEEKKLEVFAATAGIDIMSAGTIKGQQEIYAH